MTRSTAQRRTASAAFSALRPTAGVPSTGDSSGRGRPGGRRRWSLAVAVGLIGLASAPSPSLSAAPSAPVVDDAFAEPKSWTLPTEQDVRALVGGIVKVRQTQGVLISAGDLAEIEARLVSDDPATGGTMLDRVVRGLAVFEPAVADLLRDTESGNLSAALATPWAAPPGTAPTPVAATPTDAGSPSATAVRPPADAPGPRAVAPPSSDADRFVQDHARLYLGRELVRESQYDLALDQFWSLKTEEVVDPATLLFYRATCLHRLIRKRDCLDTVDRLLEREEDLPNRYVTVAKLMRADIEPMKSDSLDEIARIMRNVEDRLDNRQAGKRVRQEEEDIVKKLDKMIEDLEQQQAAAAAAAAASNTLNPSSPMQDSMPGGGTGPGDVDPKRLANSGNWGNLPPKEREDALQDLSKDLPAHYREVIEEYFRRLAQDEK